MTETAAPVTAPARIQPEALRAIADAADRHRAVVQSPRVNAAGITVACLWSGTGAGSRVVGFVAAAPDGSTAVGADVVVVCAEALAMTARR